MLLLTYPVPRSMIVLGKFIGQLIILTLAILIGYGVAALTIVTSGDAPFTDQNWLVFGKLIFSSIMLGAVFLGLGIFISSLQKESATAAAWAIGIWLLFVVFFDMALLGVLSSDLSAYLPDTVVKWVMLANPADAYRMFNLATSDETALLSGMAGLRSDQVVSPTLMIGVLASWILIVVTAFCVTFQRRRT